MSEPNGNQSVKIREDGTHQPGISPHPIRQYRTILFVFLLVSAIGTFGFLTFLVETIPSFPIDLQITRAIQSIHFPLFDWLMRLISWPGFSPQSIILSILIGLLFFVSGLRWESVTSLLASLLSGVTNELVKGLIQRPRPSVDLVDVFQVLTSYSFPSGHVMFYTTLFGFVWYVIYTLLKRSWMLSLLLTVLGLFILVIGISRIYLGQHWASDVLAAYLLGSFLLVGILLLYEG
ncbi:MAG TPA: phosphatase PAP2 family protein, partial [Anaerolineales bacterium]